MVECWGLVGFAYASTFANMATVDKTPRQFPHSVFRLDVDL
jgi:hypothetical protein